MPTKGLVSVVIPTYNRGYCLPATIESVLDQTYSNFEIIVVDDGSTDGTREILAKRFPSEPRLKYFAKPNEGVSAARNLGFKEAKGEFVALLDSDDLFLPWKLEVQVACIQRYPHASMIHSEMQAIDTDGKVYDQQHLRTCYEGYKRFALEDLYSEHCKLSEIMKSLPAGAPARLGDALVWYGDLFSHLLTGNLAHTSTILLRRKSNGEFELYDADMRTEETYPFHLRVAHAGPVVFLDAPTFSYQRGRTDHLWALDQKVPPATQLKVNQRFLATIEPYLNLEASRMRLPRADLIRTFADAHRWTAEAAALVGDKYLAAKHLVSSLRYRPWQPSALKVAAKILTCRV